MFANSTRDRTVPKRNLYCKITTNFHDKVLLDGKISINWCNRWFSKVGNYRWMCHSWNIYGRLFLILWGKSLLFSNQLRKAPLPGSIVYIGKKKTRFYWSCSSLVMKDTAPLTKLANGFSLFQFNLVCDMDMARANVNMLYMAGTLSGAFVVGIISDS